MNLVKVFNVYVNPDEVSFLKIDETVHGIFTTIILKSGHTVIIPDHAPDEVYKELNKPKPMLKGPRR